MESIVKEKLQKAIGKVIQDSPWDRITDKDKIKEYEYYKLGDHDDLIADFCWELRNNFKHKTTLHLTSLDILSNSLKINYKIW